MHLPKGTTIKEIYSVVALGVFDRTLDSLDKLALVASRRQNRIQVATINRIQVATICYSVIT